MIQELTSDLDKGANHVVDDAMLLIIIIALAVEGFLTPQVPGPNCLAV